MLHKGIHLFRLSRAAFLLEPGESYWVKNILVRSSSGKICYAVTPNSDLSKS